MMQQDEVALDQSAAIACSVGLMRMALHQPWSSGESLVIHVSQSQSERLPKLQILEPQTEPEKSMAEHLLSIDAGHEGGGAPEGDNLPANILYQCSQQFLASAPSEVRTPMQAMQVAALCTAQNIRAAQKLKVDEQFSGLLHICPAARVMTFQSISLND